MRMESEFTQKAQHVLQACLRIAGEMGHSYIGSEHLLLALTEETESTAHKLMQARGIQKEKVYDCVRAISGVGNRSNLCASDMTPRLQHIIEQSAKEAQKNVPMGIGTEHLLAALCMERESVAIRILDSIGVGAQELYGDVTAFIGASSAFLHPTGKEQNRAESRSGEVGGKYGKTPTVVAYGVDLCAAARAGKLDPVIGRDQETERMIRILVRKQKNNPCLIGEPGVGKTALAEGLALRIVDGEIPESLRDKKIIALDMAGMVAGAKYRGEFEERFKNVIREATQDSNLILFIDEIHNLIGAGAAEGAVDAANIIKPALARGDIRVIGATTIAEYRKYIEKDAALERRFQSVLVQEPTEEEAIRILQGLRAGYETHHRVSIPDSAIAAAVNLSIRYLPDRYLPDKAIDLIDEAASRIRIRATSLPTSLRTVREELLYVRKCKEEAINAGDFASAAECGKQEASLSEREKKETAAFEQAKQEAVCAVTPDDIALIVSQWTGIPVSRPEQEDTKRLFALEENLHTRVIGQDKAIQAVCRAVRRGRSGFKNPTRPIASFLFLGATGVGKTELSRALAIALFGREELMIRFDMSEYMERHSVSKLIGSPPGYVGYGEGGQLTEKVRRQPYSVVLFDEIEKAHPDVFNLLLQVLEDGRLTDARGRTVRFSDTVIIMTSNIGVDQPAAQQTLGFFEQTSHVRELSEQKVMREVRAAFRPEFLNRIDEIILFSSLGKEELIEITRMELRKIQNRAAVLGIELQFTEQAVEHIATVGADPLYGARPIRRACVRMIEDPLSDAVLSGSVRAGMTVLFDMEKDKIVFRLPRSEQADK